MPNWSSEIPTSDRHRGFDLQRTPADTALQAIVTCENLIGCWTHYWGGRTVPCEGDHCPACRENQGKRWHGYVSAFNPNRHEHFLFEFTQKAAPSFKQYFDAHGTLRGCHFCASRPKRRKNAKVVIQTKPCDLSKLTVPQAPDLIKALCVIFNVPANALPPTDAMDSHPTVTPDTDLFDKMNGRRNFVPAPDPIPAEST